jgi:hypothetical protein
MYLNVSALSTSVLIYRVIHKPLWNFWPLWYSSQDGHTKGEHVNRGRDTPQVSILPYRCSIAPFCSVSLGCCAAKFGSSRRTDELSCIWIQSQIVNTVVRKTTLQKELLYLKWDKVCKEGVLPCETHAVHFPMSCFYVKKHHVLECTSASIIS